MANRLVLFDFDGTLTKKDTLLAFIVFTHGWLRTLLGFLLLSPYIIGWKLKLLNNQYAKEKLLRHFFGGETRTSFDNRCAIFASRKLNKLIRPEATRLIQQYKESGARMIVISASPENWVAPWSKALGMECIASRMEYKDGRLTGRIDGVNCYGAEKVRRLKDVVRLEDYPAIIAYGDSSGDRELLALAHEKHYRNLSSL